MELKRIQEAYNNYVNSDFYKDLSRNRKLSDGKSAEVFFYDVVRRVKMEFMGLVDNKGNYNTYSINNFSLTTERGGNIKDLVVSCGVLQATTRLYSEYATSKPLLINCDDDLLIDYDDLLARLMVIQSWAGKVLLKAVITEDRYSCYPVTPVDYFSIPNLYNPFIKDGYVIFSIVDKNMLVEVYTDEYIQYRTFQMSDDKTKILKEIVYPTNLEECGAVKNGLGYQIKVPKIQVVEIQNIFGKSDYNDDLIRSVREIIVGDTLTSQAFQKVANPLIQVPESIIEIDSQGRSVVRLDDRIVTLRPEDRELKQVTLETKTIEWKEHKKNIVDDIYRQLGVNDLAFGISIDGAVASGEAKIRSLERVLSTVISKRNKCINGLVDITKNLIKRLENRDIEIEIVGQDILNLSLTEKINIVVQAVSNNLMSLESAISFLNIQNGDYTTEIDDIKKSQGYRQKELELLQMLVNTSRDERLQQQAENITGELIKELIGDVE